MIPMLYHVIPILYHMIPTILYHMINILYHMISGMVKEITGSYVVEYSPSEEAETTPWQVDFTPPFRRVSMIAELENKLNVTFPPATEFNTPGR